MNFFILKYLSVALVIINYRIKIFFLKILILEGENMKENKRIKIYALIALTLSVLTMSIAYAVLSTSLDIKGSATIQESSWVLN